MIDYFEAGNRPLVVCIHSSVSGARQWRRLMDFSRRVSPCEPSICSAMERAFADAGVQFIKAHGIEAGVQLAKPEKS